MQPQSASLAHPFSPPSHQRFDGGLDEIGVGVGTPAAAALACSRSRMVSDESRMGYKCERDVIQTRDVKSASVRMCFSMTFAMARAVVATEKGGYHCGGCRSAEEAARFEFTEPHVRVTVRQLRGEEVHGRDAARPEAKLASAATSTLYFSGPPSSISSWIVCSGSGGTSEGDGERATRSLADLGFAAAPEAGGLPFPLPLLSGTPL